MSDRVRLSETLIESSSSVNDIPQITSENTKEPIDFMDDFEYHRVADFFNVNSEERRDIKVAEKLSYLTDYMSDCIKDKDRLKISLALKDLKSRLGYQEQGKTLVNKLYQWARLDTDRRRIEDKMKVISITD